MTDQRPWLEKLRNDMAQISGQAARAYWPALQEGGPATYNFRLEHVNQVERDALALLKVEDGDMDTVLAAVWIHDRFHAQFDGAQHSEKAARWARENLESLGFPRYKVEDVCDAVALHTHKVLDIPASKPAARLLWDADRLARLGALGLLNFALCHTARDYLETLSHSSPDGRLTLSALASRMMERRPALYQADFYYHDEARRIARHRIMVQQQFLDVLEGQLW